MAIMLTPHKPLTERIQEWIVRDERTVDITRCHRGYNARAIKPGGVIKIVDSIGESGYKPVSSSPAYVIISAYQC